MWGGHASHHMLKLKGHPSSHSGEGGRAALSRANSAPEREMANSKCTRVRRAKHQRYSKVREDELGRESCFQAEMALQLEVDVSETRRTSNRQEIE